MTPGLAWQIRGVSRQTREAAREAARRSGTSVGDWLDRVIFDLALRQGIDPRRLAQPRYDACEEDVRPSCCLDRAIETLRNDLADIRPRLQETFQALESERDALRALMPAESLLGMAQAVQQLSQKVAKLIEKLDASEARLDHLEAIERGLAELLIHLARQRLPNLAPVAAPPRPDMEALSRDIADLRQMEKQTQSSLEVIHGALGHIVDRLTTIEVHIRGKVASPPDAPSPPALEADWFAPAPPTPPKPPIASEEPATPATAELASTVPPTAEPAAFPTFPIDADLPPDGPLEFGPGVARRRVVEPESAPGGVKQSVIPDRGGRSDFIAAARRAVQGAGRGVADNDASVVTKVAFAAGWSATGIGKLSALIGGTAAILIVLGLLQMAGMLAGASDQTIMPSHAQATPDLPPTAVRGPGGGSELASPAPPAPPPAARPSTMFSAIDGAAVATPGADILVPQWTPERQPEAAGQVQASPGGRSGAAAAFTPASAPPSAVGALRDLATPRPAQ
jgi:localization factor PodJL